MSVSTNISAITMAGSVETTDCDDELLDVCIQADDDRFLHVREFTCDDAVQETADEYGGWIIDLSKIDKRATHIYVCRF